MATATSVIPGIDSLGWGFNIFKDYAASAKTELLLDLGSDYRPIEFASHDYELPSTCSFDRTGGGDGKAHVFSSREQVQSFFRGKAGVSGSYGAFSGAFEIGYSNISKTNTAYQYGLYAFNLKNYGLSINNPSISLLAQAVQDDDDYKNLPDTFSPENAHLFYRFFAKYGTHFCSTLSVGGRMRYCTSVTTSSGYTEKDVSTKLNGEFKAGILDIKASAEAEWKNVGEKWMEDRQVNVKYVGGNTALLSVVIPAYDANFNDAFNEWKQSVGDNTDSAVIDYSLTPIATLFSGEKAAAMKSAYAAFANNRLTIRSGYQKGGTSISLSGTELQPALPPDPEPPSPGNFWVVILDRSDLSVVDKQWFLWPAGDAGAFLQQYEGNSDYLMVVATYETNSGCPPRGEFFVGLQNNGGGPVLAEWGQHSGSSFFNNAAYALVGTVGSGSGQGIEAGDIAPKPEAQGPRQIAMNVALIPDEISGKVMFKPVPG